MELKTVEVDGNTFAELQDGKPVYIVEGKEIAYDVPDMDKSLRTANFEAKSRREELEKLRKDAADYKDIDLDAARDALDKVSKMDQKKLMEAGDVDAAIAAAVKPFQEKLSAAEAEKAEIETRLSGEIINNQFANSKFVQDNLTPAGADLVRRLYADRMKMEDGQAVFYDANGQKMFSEGNAGKHASMDEAVKAFVSEYAHKDHILKGSGHSGSGAKPSSGAQNNTMTRAQFDALNDAAKREAMSEGVALQD